MNIQQRIEFLKEIIFKQVTPLIDSDYIFIDLPYYSNIGDTLIWKGTETFLSKWSYKCILRASFQTFSFPKLSKDIVIIMMGGGNWGDLYAPHNQLRRDVVKRYPDNKIVILPQTVYYEGARNAYADAIVFRKHPKLTICARDRYSYRFLKLFGFSRDVLLVPDMAFCIEADELKQIAKPLINKDLIFKRIDKEKADLSAVEKYLERREYDVSDWPLYEGKDPLVDKLYSLISKGEMTKADQFALEIYMPTRVKVGTEHISKYDRVFSNRLHGSILAILLEKSVYILDNSYGKNSQYYNTWLRDTEGIRLLSMRKPFRLKRRIRFLIYWLLTIQDRL